MTLSSFMWLDVEAEEWGKVISPWNSDESGHLYGTLESVEGTTPLILFSPQYKGQASPVSLSLHHFLDWEARWRSVGSPRSYCEACQRRDLHSS